MNKPDEFRKIPGTNYSVSFCGIIKNDKTGRILKQTEKKDGYLLATLSINGKRKLMYVHRLVAIAFVPNPLGKREVNHKDGNKSNNGVPNLEWVTSSENTHHAVNVLGKYNRNPISPEAIEARKKRVVCNETGEMYESVTQCARENGVSQSALSRNILNNTHMRIGKSFSFIK